MESSFCSDCKKTTAVVFDHSAGDTICSECGLVLEAHSIDETSEWRTFADSTDNDPIRVGEKSNPLLTGGLTTIISKPTDGSVRSINQLPFHKINTPDPDKILIEGFKQIGVMAEQLGLVSTIKDTANEIYKKMEDVKSSKGKNKEAMYAGCLYAACKKEGSSRTMKEIHSVAMGATKKDIGRAIAFIGEHLADNAKPGPNPGGNPAEFLNRFCCHLSMSKSAVRAAQEAVAKTEAFDIRRNPITVAASIIYMITQLSDDKKQIRDVSLATGVAQGTIKNSYKDIYPYASRLVPAWFANDEDLKKLCSP